MLACGPRITAWFLLLQCFISITLAFNMDTEHPIAYSGRPGTFFGYSVAMAKTNDPGDTPKILIGAPKSVYENTKFYETGVIYKCDPTPNSCDFSVINYLRGELRDNTAQILNSSWIGANIDVDPTNTKLLTCAHRWKEWSKSDSGKVTVSMRGMCYEGEIATGDYKLVRSPFQGNEAMGKDAVFSRDGSELIIGAPGTKDLSGALIIFKSSDTQKNPKIYNNVKMNNSYAGYSVSSGIFFSDKLEYYVMGAPRYNNTGTVYIIDKQTDLKQQLSHTNKLGAYFGATLCVTDINHDGYDDLLVGAPLYSQNILEGGAVMLFISDGLKLIYSRTIWGMEMERGQFGTAIKDVGDIDKDGYNDIVIGAPYEKDQEGAIYIYNLGRDGFPSNFSQRISGMDVAQGKNMSGFGISISRAVDINDDSYPDFLVGSYLSSQVRLLKARPLIAIDIDGTTNPGRINVKDTFSCASPNSNSICMKLNLRISYLASYASKLELDCKLYTEVSSLANNASSSVHRALIKSGNQYVNSLNFSQNLSSGSAKELSFSLLIKDKTNIFSPIGVFLDYKIRDGSLTNCPKLCPILKENQYKKLIPYKLDCGPDGNCTSDLHLSMAFDRDHVLYGKSQNKFKLYVSVFNRGESAYNSLALFNFPSHVQYVQVTGPECSLDTAANGGDLLRCSLLNPIPKDKNVTFTLEFANAESLQEININATVTTESEEQNEADNRAAVKIPVRMKADISIIGTPSPSRLYKSKKKSKLTHTFEIYNNGPSPLQDARIEIIVPELTEFVDINCAESTLKNCTTEFSLENLGVGSIRINVSLIVHPDIFKKGKNIKLLETRAVLTRKRNALYLDDRPNWNSTAEAKTYLKTEAGPISLWIIIVSILAGLIVLAVLIAILWKVGFFKRKKAGDLDPLTKDEKNAEPQDEKNTLQESNGNTSVPEDEEKMALSQQADVKDVEV